jgi:small-conductance mechanosensitive channel
MAPGPLSFARAAARIGRILAVVAVLGACGATVLAGWTAGAGFLLGAAISGLNYRWLYKLVEGLGAGKHPRYRSVVLAFRYLILGGAAYVILRLSPLSLPAFLAGLFVLTAAVFVEVIFEFFYARKRTVDHQDF